MRTESSIPPNAPLPEPPLWRRIFGWPLTKLGQWSAGLLFGFFVFFGLFWTLVKSGQRGGETFFSNPWLAWSMLLAMFSAIAGGITAALAIFRQRERSIVGLAAFLVGLVALLFFAGELLFPH